MLTAAAALLTGLNPESANADVLVAASSGLIGLGVGASVSPALFITGFSLRSAQIQRVFALVELLRGVTAFLVAPVLLYLATAIGTSLLAGIRASAWICLVIAAGGALLATLLFVLGSGRLQTPDLERWAGGEPAWMSPPLLGRLRRTSTLRGTCPPTERGRHRRALRTGPAIKGLLLLSQSFRSARAWFAGRRAEL